MCAAVLREHQHEISTLDGSRSLVFGTEDTGYLTLTRPARSGGEIAAGDVARVSEDGVMFGRDTRGAKSITFEMGVLTDAQNGLDGGDVHRANLDHLDALEGWWADERLRNRPRALAVLRSCEGGQTWRAYGRPRDYEEAAGPLTERGYTPVVCSFQLVDDRVYSDTVGFTQIGLVPPPESGFVFPLDSVGDYLLTFTLETEGHGVASIGGRRSTWPWVEFIGPVTNPAVEIGDLTIGLDTTLTAGQRVTVDTRPWERSVLSATGGNYAGYLSAATPPLRDCKVSPGDYEIAYRGRDQTGTAQVIVRWRDARSRP
jgi:hypothetical protein